MRIRFVTGNRGKLREARARLGPLGIRVVAARRRVEEIQADTIREVARHKAAQLVGRVPPPFFVEDAGLHVDALRGFPGGYSNYAFRTIGCRGILQLLEWLPDRERRARFVAVIAYVDRRRRIHLFQGEARGAITRQMHGRHGFGFDPIFRPRGHERTFAQLSARDKGKASHRGRALDRLAAHLLRAPRRHRRKKP